jgi:hypothetical protein
MFRELIDEFVAGGEIPRRAIAGLSDADLEAFPIPGTWSIHQVVTHLLDSDLVGADRMRRVIAMERPVLLAFDQDAFIKNLPYQTADLPLVCEVFRVQRRLTGDLLRRLPEEVFARIGDHSENGPMSLERLLRVYIGHVHHHMEFVNKKREALGKPKV